MTNLQRLPARDEEGSVRVVVEICQTGGQSKRFDVTNFAVSPLPHLVY